jgi:uncharacterized OB-fold protein
MSSAPGSALGDGLPAIPKPLPAPDDRSEGFWRAAAEHVLALQRCDSCGRIAHPPVVVCPGCLSVEPSFTFVPVDGRGRLATWTVMRDAFLPGFKGDIPWIIAEAVLDDPAGVRILGRLQADPDTPLALGLLLETVFEDVAPGIALPVWRLVG